MTDIEIAEKEATPEKDISEFINQNLDTTNADDIAAAAVAGFDDDDEEDKEKDDVVNVIIKNTCRSVHKTGTNFPPKTSTLNQKSSKVAVDIDDPGDINGKPTVEYNVSDMQDDEKPWKKPGTDITDYFNYGFTEETWLKYCEKQKMIRMEYANSTLKPLSNTNYIAGMHPKPRPNKIENIGIVQQPVFNPYMATSAAFNQNLVNVMNAPPQNNPINIVGDLNVPPPGFGGLWGVPNEGFPFINPDENRGDESPGSDHYLRKSKREYREVEGYGSRTRRRSRSDSESRHRKRRRDDREYERSSRREKSGERSSRRNRSRSRSRNRTRRHDSRDRNDRSDRDRGSRRGGHERGDRDRERRSDRDGDKSTSSRNYKSERDLRTTRLRRDDESNIPEESIINSGTNPPNPDGNIILLQGDLKQEL